MQIFALELNNDIKGINERKEYIEGHNSVTASYRTKKRAAVLYVHGKNGRAEETEHCMPLFPSCEVIGVDYKGSVPWEAGKEIHEAAMKAKEEYDRIILIANSIGAYYSMNADIDNIIAHACFISPVTDMEKLINDMMGWAGVTESELQEKGIIHTSFGEDLSWEYRCYVREHPVRWSAETDILYGENDNLVSIDTITAFVQNNNASLTVMENGEHWFHTDAQMQFLENWLKEINCRLTAEEKL